MGSRHAENLRRFVPGAKLVAVADVNGARARSVAAELGVESFETVEELVLGCDLEAVVISSPPAFHLPAIQVAAAARKHIFCEKPLSLTVEEADAALEAVRKAGTLLQVGHMRRYDPAYAEARRRIEAGEIGRVVIFKAIGRDLESPPTAPAQTPVNGTLFHDSSSHDFDLARWLTGDEIVEVFAYGGSLVFPEMRQFGAMDSGVINLRFAGGAIGNVESFMHARYGYDVRTEVVGTQSTLQIGAQQQTPIVLLSGLRRSHDVVTHWLARFAEAYRAEMIDFVRNIRESRAPRVGGREGRQSVAVAVAAVQSYREHRPIPVPAPA
jgi:predicted dehydrogenase